MAFPRRADQPGKGSRRERFPFFLVWPNGAMMPRVEFFSQFGIYYERHFLDTTLLEAISKEVHTARILVKGQVIGKQGENIDHEEWRRVRTVRLSSSLQSQVNSRLALLRPNLAEHFSCVLHGQEPFQCLLYRSGDYYKYHQDVLNKETIDHSARARRVSLVLFVNGEGEDPELSYQGGALTLYGLIQKKSNKNFGLPVQPEPGLMVAFPSTMFHEVAPVSQGCRVTIVSFFYNSCQI